jgi:annexin A6
MTVALSLQDLMADLKSEISGDLARLILGLMMPPAHYDAKQLKKAMEVLRTY